MKYLLIFLFFPLSILCQPKNFNDIPNKYSLEKYTPTPIYQGQTPLCAAYALTNMRSIVYNINKNITSKTVKDSNRFSPFFLYYLVMGNGENSSGKFAGGLRQVTQRNKIGCFEFLKNYGIAKRIDVEGDSLFVGKTRIWCYPNSSVDMHFDLHDAKKYKIDSFAYLNIGEKITINNNIMRQSHVCDSWIEAKKSTKFFDKIFNIKRDTKNKKVRKKCHKNNGKFSKTKCDYHEIGKSNFWKIFMKKKESKKIYKTSISDYGFYLMKKMISNNIPLYIGFKLPINFSKSKDIVDMTGQVKCGSGHAMVLIGYNDSIQAFRIMNSWKGWGDGEGFSWIKYKDMEQLYNLSIYQIFASDIIDLKQENTCKCNGNKIFIRKGECQCQSNQTDNFLYSDYEKPIYNFLNSNRRDCY